MCPTAADGPAATWFIEYQIEAAYSIQTAFYVKPYSADNVDKYLQAVYLHKATVSFQAPSQNREKRLWASSCQSVRMEQSAPTTWIFMKIDIWAFIEDV
jgi:hypothetical protein